MVLDMAHLSCLVVLMQLGMLLYNGNNHYIKSGSGSRGIGNNFKVIGRSFGAVGNSRQEKNNAKISTPWIIRTYPWKGDGSLRSWVET